MLRTSERARSELADRLATLIEGTAPPRLIFYDGAMPPAPDAQPVDQQVLAVLFLRSPAFATDGLGAMIALPIDPRPGLRAGTATWARILNGDGDPVADLDVGGPGTDADIILNQPISAGPVEISHFEIRFF